jgi:hypothetical protein
VKIVRYECESKGCHKVTNGNLSGWYAVGVGEDYVCVRPMVGNEDTKAYKHACGESCAISMVSASIGKMAK